jgi:hypothetical protein
MFSPMIKFCGKHLKKHGEARKSVNINIPVIRLLSKFVSVHSDKSYAENTTQLWIIKM